MPKKEVRNNDVTQLEQPKKSMFLEFYGKTRGNISVSAKAVDIARGTYYNWLKSDEQFKTIKETLDEELNDEMRQALIDLAGEGNLGAIIFYLKRRHPEFKQVPPTIGARTDGETIEVVITDYKG